VKNLSLEIQAGEYVALVGSSGIGKTTLCSLIPHFYEANAGKILLDGQDIRDVTLRSLRRNIGIVQQDVYLFAGTIADNIRYGKLDASRQEIIDAAKQAHAHDFIMAFPDGYDTDIGQRGVRLSGGQKQRLSIARLMFPSTALEPPAVPHNRNNPWSLSPFFGTIREKVDQPGFSTCSSTYFSPRVCTWMSSARILLSQPGSRTLIRGIIIP